MALLYKTPNVKIIKYYMYPNLEKQVLNMNKDYFEKIKIYLNSRIGPAKKPCH